MTRKAKGFATRAFAARVGILVLLVGLISFASLSWGADSIRSPQSKAEYCALVKQKRTFLHLLNSTESRLDFKNPGGFFNTGLCWWHSRLQRSSLYLSIYQPHRVKPNEAQIFAILDALYNQRAIIAIPGYANFRDFSSSNHSTIVKYLSTSQILDSIQGEWVAGLIGHSQVGAGKLQKLIEGLYQDSVKNGNAIYQMLQMPGVVAHAWLVLNVTKQGGNYTLTYVDSNYPLETKQYTYRVGETTFIYNSGTNFVPYTKESSKMNRVWELAQRFCQ
ncbi:MAG: hypothetical protein V4736_13650 [Bdellovibrionota bacterium]